MPLVTVEIVISFVISASLQQKNSAELWLMSSHLHYIHCVSKTRHIQLAVTLIYINRFWK